MFPYPIGTPTESLSGNSQVVGLVLQGIEPFATLGDFVDILTHHTDGVIDLLEKFKSDYFVQSKRAAFDEETIRAARVMEMDHKAGRTACKAAVLWFPLGAPLPPAAELPDGM